MTAWANGRRVFVSSLITDMPQERSAVRAAIESIGATPVRGFRSFGCVRRSGLPGRGAQLRGLCGHVGTTLWRTHARRILGDPCRVSRGRTQRTEALPVRAWRDIGRDGRCTTGSHSGRAQPVYDQFLERFSRFTAASNSAAKGFRAREITSDGRRISITADVRSDAVHAELVRLRDGRASGVAFASPTEALSVQLTELSTRTISTIAHEERLTLVAQERRTSHMRTALNGISADEVARRALSDGLFRTSTLGEQARWLARPTDPLAPLRGSGLDDSVLRPIARLLIAEQLITEGSASRVDSFALGPAHHGARRLQATWTPPQIYVNEPEPASLSIDGTVTGL